MKFRRSLRGYSAEQVKNFLNERSMTFQARRQELESDLGSITRAGQELDQLLNRLQMQLEQTRQRQQTIDSAKPDLDLFLSQCQDYAASQAENFVSTNDDLLAEIALQNEQIDADQNKLKLFWQTLHANLGDLLNVVELEESSGKSLLNKYISDLEARNIHSDIDNSGVVQHESLPDIDRLELTQLEPQSDFDRLKTTQHEYPDVDRFSSTQYDPLPVFNAFSATQKESLPVFNAFNATRDDSLPVSDAFSATPKEFLPAAEDTIQVEAENNSLSFVENVSNVLEAEQTTQAMVASSKQQALIADGEATVIAMLRIILERDNFSIIECNDGHQASQNIDRIDPPLLAILETKSPNVNGLELVRKIRSKPEWAHCTIIMLTDKSSEHEIADLLEAGANDYISKPVNTRDPVARVHKLTGIEAAAL